MTMGHTDGFIHFFTTRATSGRETRAALAGMLGIDVQHGLASWISAIAGSTLLLVLYHLMTARTATAVPGGPATNDDYKRAVFNDLSRGPNG